MSAKWKRTIRLAAVAVWLSACPVAAVSGAPATTPVSPSKTSPESPAAERLTRSDVDKLLRQAETAIEQGNLDQADVLVRRAEASGIRYPLLHFGLTPSKVRFQLTRAQRAAPSRPQPAEPSRPGEHAAATGSADDAATDAMMDPFEVRQPALPAAPNSQPVPPSLGHDHLPGDLPRTGPASNVDAALPYGESVGNPFKKAQATGDSIPAPARQVALPRNTGDEIRQPMGLMPREPNDLATSLAARDEVSVGAGAIGLGGESAPGVPMRPGIVGSSDPVQTQAGLPQTTVPTMALSTGVSPKRQAMDRLADAREALAAGDLDAAEQLVSAASALAVSESQYLPNEDRPSLVAWDIRQARARRAAASAEGVPAQALNRPAQHDRYEISVEPAQHSEPRLSGAGDSAIALTPPQTNLRTAQMPRELQVPADGPAALADEPSPFADDPLPYAPESIPYPATSNDAATLLEEGEAALRRGDHDEARALLDQAYDLRDELDASSRERLQEHLQMLPTDRAERARAAASTPSLLDRAASDEQALARQLSAEVGKQQSEARRLREENPRQALESLREIRQKVADSKVSEEYRAQLLRRIDFTLEETEKYLHDHRVEIELNEQNQAVLEEVERTREVRVKVQEKIADLVDQFNKLRDEQRYAEMEVVARRLYEMAPNDPVAQQVWQNAKFIRRTIMNQDLADRREESYWETLNDVENSAVQDVGDGREMKYDQKRWDALVKHRKGSQERDGRRTERELEIERRLKTPVLLRYEDTPLSEVVNGLAELAGVNIHLDPRGLSQEGVNSDTPVTINLSKEISLKSALNLVLEPLHLSYVVKDEVLKITSEQLRDGEVYSKVYNVADLVVPIPNFVPSSNIGLQGLINDAHAAMGYGNGVGMPGPAVLVGSRGAEQGAGAGNNQLLAQQIGAASGGGIGSASVPLGGGPGGMGGGANADFESLIDLIVSTVATDTWAENGGGEAEIREFETNLSLVISQTQAVHEQVADLLAQLRRLQDLQVTIEVRFIRLNDRFFERIGIDFDMNILSNTTGTPGLLSGTPPAGVSSVVGLQPPVPPLIPFPGFTADLDIPFRQGSFGLSTPTIGPISTAADFGTFGFAILSDIEAYFLIEAAQGDRRSNVLQAPKVTLFNGQQAIVTDVVQTPFVVGVIPVVSEFAAAQQPIIVVLNEGTLMSIQAVVSDDRRYVRLTVVPFFTAVGDVDTFTFEGSTSSTSSSSSSSSGTDNDDDGNNESGETSNETGNETFQSGVTVQLPEFQVVTVATTVSVPDGGTVLLGGIKRLSEERSEFGVPLLSKIPYVNRLFRNVGIGRDTDSLMMMVTPRIIIQEEEEDRMGIAAGP